MRKVNKKLEINIALVAASLMLTILMTNPMVDFVIHADVQPGQWDFPVLDEILFKIVPPDQIVEAANKCELDVVPSTTLDIAEQLRDIGWSIENTCRFDYMITFVKNCRNEAPSTSGQYVNYHNRAPGFPLYPLDITAFRYALELIIGSPESPIGNLCPMRHYVPPSNLMWHNFNLESYPQNWELAYEILLSAGFQGTIGGNDWIMPNGVPLNERLGDPVIGEYAIYVMAPEESPTMVEIARRIVETWNMFFCGQEIGIFVLDIQPFTQQQLVVFGNRDYDISIMSWSITRNPDYLYAFFHSTNDEPWSTNVCGVDYRPLDALLYSLKFGEYVEHFEKNWIGPGPMTIPRGTEIPTRFTFKPESELLWVGLAPACPGSPWYRYELVRGVDYEIVRDINGNGKAIRFLRDISLQEEEYIHIVYEVVDPVFISEVDEIRQICWDSQEMLYFMAPFSPLFSKYRIDAFKQNLTCWINSPGFGAASHQLKWTFGSIRWDYQQGGSVDWFIDPISTLNPAIATSISEWTILNRLYDRSLEINAYTHTDIPWMAIRYTIAPWRTPTEHGMIITFYIRTDLYWQDGDHITVDDFIWQLNFINSCRFETLRHVWSSYKGAVKHNDYVYSIYVNTTGLWKFYDYAYLPLMFPKKVWEPFFGDPAGAEAFRPWEIAYTDWVPEGQWGPHPPPKCLYGTAEWIFDWYDPILGIIRVYKNPYWWGRKAAYPSKQIPGVHAPTDANKEITITFSNQTPIPPNENIKDTIWHWDEPAPLNSTTWLVIKHEDYGGDGLTPCDWVTIYPPAALPFISYPTLRGHVEQVIRKNSKVTMKIKVNLPKVIKTVVGLYKFNLDTKLSNEHSWEFSVDGEVVATGEQTLKPLDFHHWWEQLPWQILEPGLHIFVLNITSGSSTNIHQTLMIVLIGDVDNNNIINMIDLYMIALRYGWTGPPCGVNEDINNDGIVNMLDLYIVALTFGSTDP